MSGGRSAPGAPLACLVGPTAVGKSQMAIEVALALKDRGREIEIVSCDSMGVYRGLDIVADKPAPEDRKGIVHHLFDVADPDEDFTAVAYRMLAREAIDNITSRGGSPMLVGGSGLYFRSVVDELEFAPTSPEVRARLESADPGELMERLRSADPATAERLDPRNVRRIVRAVEVLELTGRPPSELRTSWEPGGGPYRLRVIGLTRQRPELLMRAEERVRRELEAGLVAEVERVRSGRGLSRTAAQALGVKEILPYLDGQISLEEAAEGLIRNTKSFVRRQLSWFSSDDRVDWIDLTETGWGAARAEIVGCFEDLFSNAA